MTYLELVDKVNSIDPKAKNQVKEIVENINIKEENINEWINDIFSDKINLFDMEKLPYLIDELYKTDNQLKFMLFCMLLESSCDKLKFITNLENYPVFKAKFEYFIHTLVTVYDRVDNGIANCMALIIVNNDPKLTLFEEDAKQILIQATRRKLKDILEYLKGGQINPIVFCDIEAIADMACYLHDEEISKLIDEIDSLGSNEYADIFIIKYKIINKMQPIESKINTIINDEGKELCTLYGIIEKLGAKEIYLKDVTQEALAKSDLIRWLEYPTELGSAPDKIELLGELTIDNEKIYAFKFSKENFKIKGNLIGISGGYPINEITSQASGLTFSTFEQLTDNWEEQAIKITNLIKDYWKNRANN